MNWKTVGLFTAGCAMFLLIVVTIVLLAVIVPYVMAGG